MVDEKQVGVPDTTLDLDESQRLIALGFDPVAPVYISSDGCSEEAIARALFRSDRDEPETVQFKVEVRDADDCILPMEVELVQLVFVTNLDSKTGSPDPYDDPAWYLRGHLGRCSLNPNREVIRMHAYTHELRDDLEATVQIVREMPVKTPAISLDGCLTQSWAFPQIASRLTR